MATHKGFAFAHCLRRPAFAALILIDFFARSASGIIIWMRISMHRFPLHQTTAFILSVILFTPLWTHVRIHGNRMRFYANLIKYYYLYTRWSALCALCSVCAHRTKHVFIQFFPFVFFFRLHFAQLLSRPEIDLRCINALAFIGWMHAGTHITYMCVSHHRIMCASG